MENENEPTLENRVAYLEKELERTKSIMSALGKSFSDQLQQHDGAFQPLYAVAFALCQQTPSESRLADVIRFFLEQTAAVQGGIAVPDVNLNESERHAADLSEMLVTDPTDPPRLPDGYKPPPAER